MGFTFAMMPSPVKFISTEIVQQSSFSYFCTDCGRIRQIRLIVQNDFKSPGLF